MLKHTIHKHTSLYVSFHKKKGIVLVEEKTRDVLRYLILLTTPLWHIFYLLESSELYA
jgi:hypothetical protein